MTTAEEGCGEFSHVVAAAAFLLRIHSITNLVTTADEGCGEFSHVVAVAAFLL